MIGNCLMSQLFATLLFFNLKMQFLEKPIYVKRWCDDDLKYFKHPIKCYPNPVTGFELVCKLHTLNKY